MLTCTATCPFDTGTQHSMNPYIDLKMAVAKLHTAQTVPGWCSNTLLTDLNATSNLLAAYKRPGRPPKALAYTAYSLVFHLLRISRKALVGAALPQTTKH